MPRTHYIMSKITGRTYDLFGVIRILNISQCIFYLENGIILQDIEISEDRKTNKPILVFLFNRDDTKQIFDEWCKRKQEDCV